MAGKPIITQILERVGSLLGNSGITEIRQAQVPAPNIPTRPAIIYWPGNESMEEDSAEATKCYLELYVMILGKTDQDTFGEAMQLRADVVESIWGDCSIGGLAFWVTEIDAEVYAGDITAPDFTVMLEFQVFYRHKIGNLSEQ